MQWRLKSLSTVPSTCRRKIPALSRDAHALFVGPVRNVLKGPICFFSRYFNPRRFMVSTDDQPQASFADHWAACPFFAGSRAVGPRRAHPLAFNSEIWPILRTNRLICKHRGPPAVSGACSSPCCDSLRSPTSGAGQAPNIRGRGPDASYLASSSSTSVP